MKKCIFLLFIFFQTYPLHSVILDFYPAASGASIDGFLPREANFINVSEIKGYLSGFVTHVGAIPNPDSACGCSDDPVDCENWDGTYLVHVRIGDRNFRCETFFPKNDEVFLFVEPQDPTCSFRLHLGKTAGDHLTDADSIEAGLISFFGLNTDTTATFFPSSAYPHETINGFCPLESIEAYSDEDGALPDFPTGFFQLSYDPDTAQMTFVTFSNFNSYNPETDERERHLMLVNSSMNQIRHSGAQTRRFATAVDGLFFRVRLDENFDMNVPLPQVLFSFY